MRGEIDEVEQAGDPRLAHPFFYTKEAYSLVSTCESQATSKSAQKRKVKRKSHHEAWSVRKVQGSVCGYTVVSHESVY